jgi:16S rRNA processing protein RimM
MPARAVAEPVVVGRIGGAWGVLGWLRVTSFTDPPEHLFEYRPWLVESPQGWRTVTPERCQPRGVAFVVRLREVTSREAAQALAGHLLAVPRSALPEIDEADTWYWRDLIGLAVCDTRDRCLGSVDHLFTTGAHDVLVVRGQGEDVLIPFVRQFVVAVDLEGRRLVVDWQHSGQEG